MVRVRKNTEVSIYLINHRATLETNNFLKIVDSLQETSGSLHVVHNDTKINTEALVLVSNELSFISITISNYSYVETYRWPCHIYIIIM